MKTMTFLFAILTIVMNIELSNAQIFKNDEVSISKLEDKVWVLETLDKTTMYLVEGTKRALLIDTGTKCKNLDSILKTITTKPLSVVITHFHPDHAGNIYQFNSIFMHQGDTALFNLQTPYAGKVKFVKDGYKFDLGGKVIEVVYTPAHTPGSIILIDKKAGLCFSGDAFGSGQVWLQLKPLANMSVYVESCKEMEKLMDEGITKVYCGHYPYVKKAYYKTYIISMRTLAEQLIKGNAPESKDFQTQVSINCANPKIVTLNEASIVYSPDYLK